MPAATGETPARARATHAVDVLHVILGLGTGGVERGLQNVVLGLRARGHRQGVACLEDEGTLGRELRGVVPVWSGGPAGRRSRAALILALARHMRTFRPDVVHARNCTAWLYAWTAWTLSGRRARLVFSIHGLDWSGPISPARILAYRWMSRSTSALVAVADATAEAFSAATGIPRARFQVVHSGVDLASFRPAEDRGQRGAGDCLLGCVARLGARKGHEHLLRAVARLRTEGVAGVRVELVGDGPHRTALERLARNLGIAEIVTFAGEMRDVTGRLAAMDVFVLPSLTEGRPTAIMEAMAAGLPVVATQVGAVDTLVNDGVTGFVVPPGDADALAAALRRLIEDTRLRETFGRAARRTAEEAFSLTRMVNGYESIYSRAAEDTRALARARSPQGPAPGR